MGAQQLPLTNIACIFPLHSIDLKNVPLLKAYMLMCVSKYDCRGIPLVLTKL